MLCFGLISLFAIGYVCVYVRGRGCVISYLFLGIRHLKVLLNTIGAVKPVLVAPSMSGASCENADTLYTIMETKWR